MAKIGVVRKSKKQQALDAELGLIIDEVGRAMWSASKEYVAMYGPTTANIRSAMYKFQAFCEEHYGEKA